MNLERKKEGNEIKHSVERICIVYSSASSESSIFVDVGLLVGVFEDPSILLALLMYSEGVIPVEDDDDEVVKRGGSTRPL